MGKDQDKKKKKLQDLKAKKKQDNKEKKAKKSPPKRKTLGGALFKLTAILVIVAVGGGVGYFYWKEGRLPTADKKDINKLKGYAEKGLEKGKETSQQVWTSLKKKWEELDLTGNKIANNYDDLLDTKKKGTDKGKSATNGGDTQPPASMKPDPTVPHIQASKKHFDEGRANLKKFFNTKDKSALKKARKLFRKSISELEQAKAKSNDDRQKEQIDGQLQQVQAFQADATRMGGM